MQKNEFNQGLLAYLAQSPTPFHATAELKKALQAAGYIELHESECWQLERGGQYFVTRNDSSIVAFQLGEEDPIEAGFRMMGAHTDSPALKVKPNADMDKKSYFQLGVEVYGGVLLNPWFDRDLSLAGRVTLRDVDGQLSHQLINFARPIAIIPSLAIHLDREANENRKINKQTDLPPLICCLSEEAPNLITILRDELGTTHDILDSELYFYDTQPPGFVGLKEEFIASARLDNLLSCYTGLQALLSASAKQPVLLVCNDHEEVGSGSTSGARGNLLRSVLERIAGNDEAMARMIAQSMMISTDNAHGIHPNFADRHDERHGPILNQGPVIKVNSNQAYASNSETIGLYKHFCEQAAVPYQSFVTRSDMGCGSTIGPITATGLGVKTIDVGVPTFAMHSIRELAGTEDAWSLCLSLKTFCEAASLNVPLR